MKKWVIAAAASVATVLLLHPVASHAAKVSGRLSSVLEWYDDPEGDSEIPLMLYGYLNASDLGDTKGLNFRGYGRLGSEAEDKDSRLYYGYLEKKDLVDGLDARLGRQFVGNTAAGTKTIDGLDVDYKFADMAKVKFFYGGYVTFEDEYKGGNSAMGAEIRLGGGQNPYDVGFSYYQQRDESDLAIELLGVDAYYDVVDTIDFTYEVQYNNLKQQVSYLLLESRYYRSPLYQFRLHYLYDMPVFESTSIYSVFAVDKYEEITGELTYYFARDTRGVARVTKEIYETGSDADVYELGVEKFGLDQWSGYFIGTYRNDPDGQDLQGFKASVGYKVDRFFQPAVGLSYDVLERRREEDGTTTSTRVWASVRSEITNEFSMEAKVETASSDLYDHYNYGRIQANYRF